MTEWIDRLDYILIGAMLALTLLGFIVAAVMPGIEKWNKRFFAVLFSVLFLLVCLIIADMILFEAQVNLTLEKLIWFIESALLSLPMFMFTIYLLHFCGENRKKSLLFWTALICLCIYLIPLWLAQFTDLFYDLTPDYQFVRGPLYSLIPIAPLVMMFANILGVMRRRGKLSKRRCWAYLIYLLPMTAAILIHAIVFSFQIVAFGFTLSTLSMFIIILLEQVEQDLKQQREIAAQRADILILQMRPHFIYNTMMSIYYLCLQNPKKAQSVTLDFTSYLRRNFTAIASAETIPFSEELEHTRAYLSVEQAQFEDGLFVEYDTPHTDFRLPPLTLQPIVENAVKHGMDPDSEPLHVFIRTRKTDSGSEILVEDDGTGFEPANDDEPHIALSNIRQRLELMCRGKLTILPREGGGTMVKAEIPS